MTDLPSILMTFPVVLFAYLCGSIPTGLILGRLMGAGDLRAQGSGNIGATNALRTGNKMLALLTLIGDLLKGLVPIIGVHFLMTEADANFLAPVAALCTVLGHMYPVWLRFKGGKGVATGIGVLLGLAPMAALVSFISWLFVFAVSRISSLSALVTTLIAPASIWAGGYFGFWMPPALRWSVTLICALIWWRHRANIGRLVRGQEPRFGAKK